MHAFIPARKEESPIVEELRDFLCTFVYKHEIWHRCRPEHTELIFLGRQSRRSLASPQSQNPIWPPADIRFGHNFVTKSRRIMRDSSFYMFLT